MTHRIQLVSFAAALTVVAGLAAAAPVLGTISGDAAFLALTNNGALERAVAEGRSGNLAGNGDWEQGIWQQGSVGVPVAQAQQTITNGTALAFRIVYDGVSALTYTVNGVTISYNTVAGPFTDIFIRTRAGNGTTMALSQLNLTGLGAFGPIVTTGAGSDALGYVRITEAAGFGAFTLSGTQTISWTGAAPRGSGTAYQLKFTNVVPAPMGAAMLGLGGLLAARRRRV